MQRGHSLLWAIVGIDEIDEFSETDGSSSSEKDGLSEIGKKCVTATHLSTWYHVTPTVAVNIKFPFHLRSAHVVR